MDASALLARRKAQTIYRDNVARLVATDPSYGNISTCNVTTTIPLNFPSFADKQAFFTGKEECTNCCSNCKTCSGGKCGGGSS